MGVGPARHIGWVAVAATVGCDAGSGGFRHAESIEEWVQASTLDGCDLAYAVREVAWDESPGGGWPAPNEAVDDLGGIDVEVVWGSDSIHPPPELDDTANAWLGPMTRW